ncbi:MAG: GHKL domain-containing protein, partial [Bdellovibrionales bacterium]|nr:GHKL domain-containing protein [Bdellovibrionales bacterium]
AAEEILGLGAEQVDQAKTLDALLDQELLGQIQTLLIKTFAPDEEERDERAEQEVRLEVHGMQKRIICTAGRLESDLGIFQGGVLLFDDVTALSRAQQQAAWREAARRIAHEIKNPLTPLKLSAQRLLRLAETGAVDPRAKESAGVIVEHVDSIKRLTDEFSKFARMPDTSFAPCQLNDIVQSVLQGFVDSYPQVVFQFIPGEDIPSCMLDKEHMMRCVFNLVENAAAAVNETPASSEPPRVTIRTGWNKKRDIATIEVLDNGPGIPATVRDRIFEPYFTTKEKGSGLGLAIVNSVVSDHQGSIQIKRRGVRGTQVIIELPTRPDEATKRKFAMS